MQHKLNRSNVTKFNALYTFVTNSNRNENHRIVIVPWPAYTDAFKAKDQKPEGNGGNLIEGHVRITKYGPRIFWKKHKLLQMPMGYGGCYIAQRLPTGSYR